MKKKVKSTGFLETNAKSDILQSDLIQNQETYFTFIKKFLIF